jgi:hypothetical protein
MMIELCGQQKIHQISKLVDGTIQMPPSAVDLVVGFADPGRSQSGRRPQSARALVSAWRCKLDIGHDEALSFLPLQL